MASTCIGGFGHLGTVLKATTIIRTARQSCDLLQPGSVLAPWPSNAQSMNNMNKQGSLHVQEELKAELMGGNEPSAQEEDMWFRERNR